MAVVFAVDVRLPMANEGRNFAGTPVSPIGVAGTICGLTAVADLRSMLSEPMRITPALALLRSIVKPVAVNVANGAVVPALVQSTCRRAGTDNSALMADA